MKQRKFRPISHATLPPGYLPSLRNAIEDDLAGYLNYRPPAACGLTLLPIHCHPSNPYNRAKRHNRQGQRGLNRKPSLADTKGTTRNVRSYYQGIEALMSADKTTSNQTRAPRKALPAMYTSLQARPAGSQQYCWSGFIYDISKTGMRIELDDALDSNAPIECEITLPPITSKITGDPKQPITFHATGRVVRVHDDEPGPVRMGLTFDDFTADTDRKALENYLSQTA